MRKMFSARLNPLTTDRLEIMNQHYNFGKGRLIDRAVKILYTALRYAENESCLDKDKMMSLVGAIIDEIQNGD